MQLSLLKYVLYELSKILYLLASILYFLVYSSNLCYMDFFYSFLVYIFESIVVVDMWSKYINVFFEIVFIFYYIIYYVSSNVFVGYILKLETNF